MKNLDFFLKNDTFYSFLTKKISQKQHKLSFYQLSRPKQFYIAILNIRGKSYLTLYFLQFLCIF